MRRAIRARSHLSAERIIDNCEPKSNWQGFLKGHSRQQTQHSHKDLASRTFRTNLNVPRGGNSAGTEKALDDCLQF